MPPGIRGHASRCARSCAALAGLDVRSHACGCACGSSLVLVVQGVLAGMLADVLAVVSATVA